MHKHICHIVTAICLALILLAGTASPAAAQETVSVLEVLVTGNQNINAETIRAAIALKPGDEFTEQKAEKDRAAIMSLGYFSAVTLHREKTAEGIKLTYEVTENPKVMNIKVTGTGPVPAEAILAVMKTKPGQVLSTTTLNQDIEAIQSYYREQRYLAYVNAADIGIDPGTGVLTLEMLVSRVESIEIDGNKKTKPYVFLREMKTKPGDYLNLGVLEKDMMKIYSLDLLEEIQPYDLKPGSDMGKVKVIIPVKEKKTGQVTVGLGYSSRQRLVGRATLSETNFRGQGQGVNLLWEQGTTDAVGGSASYEVGFSEPWIDKRHTSLSVSAYNKILYRFSSGVFNSSTFADNETYNERHKGADFTLSRPLSELTRLFLGGRFENVDTNPNLLSTADNDYAKIVQKGDVAAASLRFLRDSRDIQQDPAGGGYILYAAEFGSVDAERFVAPVAPETEYTSVPFKGGFTKGSIDFRRYFSLNGPRTKPTDKKTVLAIRLRAGVARGTLPFFEQYFVGGAESLRGYREDRFWGRNMFVASVEYRRPIAQAITGVVFADYGSAWDAPAEFNIGSLPQQSSFSGKLGIGIGMRVTTPIGYIRLDYGTGSEGGRTHFSMGQAF